MHNSNAQRLICEIKNLKKFSRDIGVGYQTLIDVKSGKTEVGKMAVGTFIKLARGLGMTADELYYGSEQTKKDPRESVLLDSFNKLDDLNKDTAVIVVDRLVASVCTQDEAARAAAAQVS